MLPWLSGRQIKQAVALGMLAGLLAFWFFAPLLYWLGSMS
jgi:hypothetical protein